MFDYKGGALNSLRISCFFLQISFIQLINVIKNIRKNYHFFDFLVLIQVFL